MTADTMTLDEVKALVAIESDPTRRVIAVQLAYNLGFIAASEKRVADLQAQLGPGPLLPDAHLSRQDLYDMAGAK